MIDIRLQGTKANSLSNHAKKRTKQLPLLCCTEEDGRITSITMAQASQIIRLAVKAIVACGESLERFHDLFVRAPVLQRCPAIAGYLPVDTVTLFGKYVPLNVMETSLHLNLNSVLSFMMSKFSNLLTVMLVVAFDDMTVNKQCKTCITMSEGKMSIFWSW